MLCISKYWQLRTNVGEGRLLMMSLSDSPNLKKLFFYNSLFKWPFNDPSWAVAPIWVNLHKGACD